MVWQLVTCCFSAIVFVNVEIIKKKRWMLCPSKEMTRTHRHICCQVFRVFQHELELFPSHGLMNVFGR